MMDLDLIHPDTVTGSLVRTVHRCGEATALRYKKFGLWHDISWNDYFQRVKWVALALLSMGLEKGDRVSIIGDNCPEWVFIDLGIQCAGGVAVGIYSTNAAAQCEYVIQNSGSRVFFVEKRRATGQMARFSRSGPLSGKGCCVGSRGTSSFRRSHGYDHGRTPGTGKSGCR